MFYSVKIFLFPSSRLVAGGRACNAEIVVVGGRWLCWLCLLHSIPGELSDSLYSPSQPPPPHETEIDWRGGRKEREGGKTRARAGRGHSDLEASSYLAVNLENNICHGDCFTLQVISGQSDQYLEWS